jgi:pimeloyl-ACP methyl ester carboxylesterase
VLHGAPGSASGDNLRALEAVARDRLVVEYDQIDTGRSQRLGDSSAYTVDRHVEELDAVRRALGLERVHIVGMSWGGMLALAYALEQPDAVASIVLTGAPHSVKLWVEATERFRAELPPRNLRALERCEATFLRRGPRRAKAGGGPSSAKLAKQAATLAKLIGIVSARPVQAIAELASFLPPLRRAVYPVLGLPFTRRHVFRHSPIPPGALVGMTGMNAAVYETMWGPSEHFATGPLKDFDLTDRLHELSAPLLITSGGHEAVRPEHVQVILDRVPGAEWVLFEESAHAGPYEEPERYASVLQTFLMKVDGR